MAFSAADSPIAAGRMNVKKSAVASTSSQLSEKYSRGSGAATAASITQPMKTAPTLSSTPTVAPMKVAATMAGQAPFSAHFRKAPNRVGGGPSAAAKGRMREEKNFLTLCAPRAASLEYVYT